MAKRRKTEAPVVDSLATVTERWPGREDEVARLFRLLRDEELAPGSLFVHGPSGGGKSGIVKDVLAALAVPHAVVDCVGCSTPRALWPAQPPWPPAEREQRLRELGDVRARAAPAAALRDVLAARGHVPRPRERRAARRARAAARRRSRCQPVPRPPRRPALRRRGARHDFHLSRASPTSSPSPSPAISRSSSRSSAATRRRRSPRPAAAEAAAAPRRRRQRRQKVAARRRSTRPPSARLRVRGRVLCRPAATQGFGSGGSSRPLSNRSSRTVVAGDVSWLMARAKLLSRSCRRCTHDDALVDEHRRLRADPARDIGRPPAQVPRRRRLPRLALPAARRLGSHRARQGGRPPRSVRARRRLHAFTLERLLGLPRDVAEARGLPPPRPTSSSALQRGPAPARGRGAPRRRALVDVASDVADVAAEISFELSVYLK